MFIRSDASLFRSLTTLGQKAGVKRSALARLSVKELADNALDAGATCRIGEVKGRKGWFYVEDDGPGIDGTDEEVAHLYSFGRDLTSSKLFRLPTRGALGNGLRVVAGVVLASQGELRVRTRGRWMEMRPQDDGTTAVKRLTGSAIAEGTRVEVKFGAELADDDPLSMAQLSVAFRGASTYTGKTSPWWYDDESFFELLVAAPGTVGELLSGVMDGWTKGLPAGREKASEVTRERAESILRMLRSTTRPVKPERLGAVGDCFDTHGYAKVRGVFRSRSGRSLASAELPFVVEAWATRQQPKDDPSATFFVNRTVVVARTSCEMQKAETAFFGCGLAVSFKTGRLPMQYMVNIQTPYMPITTDGKEPDLEPLENEIGEAVCRAARRARSGAPRGAAVASKKDAIINAIPDAIEKASGGKRFSLRQLYYAVRPIFQGATGEADLDYGYFASVITDYEAKLGNDIPLMYRDARGTLYHPHTGETIPLGTLNVERYKRPEWTFNKVLYCEKEGFFPLLLDEKWPERHDCALLTSKGFASRAARDVIDALGDDGGELLFFAIHDADGPGTKILEALQEATRARPARRVKIVDLGLNPWEAVEAGLEIERVERKGGGRVPVAEYVRRRYLFGDDSTDWEEWLQTQRVELNAMTSPAFLAWLDRKLEEHDQGKVVPPDTVLGEKLAEATEKEVRERLTAKILEEAKLDDQVEGALGELPELSAKKLRTRIERDLDKVPEELWSVPLDRIAAERASKVVTDQNQKGQR